MTNAIELLKDQHDEVKDLFEQIESSSGQEKQSLFREIADNLAAHMTIEEEVFYPAAYAKQTKDLLTEAVEEHLGLKRLIRDLLTMQPGDPQFDAKVKVLKEQVEHHVEEEEEDLFEKVTKDMSAKELTTMGSRMEEMFDSEMNGYPSEQVPEQTARAASLK
ncbi:MAG: hemerythrin domain-containing protein [Myxococcales bacterium]|nr:hemerythrin domain-containing protein [Myxococcales bacterium]MCB9709496.1 hemerythrin domain-containing protein [Myxococcales bacterium]